MIIRYVLDDAYPNYLTDPPMDVWEWDESIHHDQKDNPWAYICTKHDCNMRTMNDKIQMTNDLIHQSYSDHEYDEAALQYVTTMENLASVNTIWLQACIPLFSKKIKEIKSQQFNFRNVHILPESCELYDYPSLQKPFGCGDKDADARKTRMHEAIQDCNAIKAAFDREGRILREYHDRISEVERRLGCAMRAARPQVKIDRLRVEKDKLKVKAQTLALGKARLQVGHDRWKDRAQTLEMREDHLLLREARLQVENERQ